MNEIGELLKTTREATGITLDEVGTDLDIKPVILDNIENGNLGPFKDIYLLKEYLFDYAKYLGLDADKVIKDFNEYMFEYTSKIPIKEIEEKILEKKKLEETTEIKIASPYTDDTRKYKTKWYIFLYIMVMILVALAIFWSVKQITVGSRSATIIAQK